MTRDCPINLGHCEPNICSAGVCVRCVFEQRASRCRTLAEQLPGGSAKAFWQGRADAWEIAARNLQTITPLVRDV